MRKLLLTLLALFALSTTTQAQDILCPYSYWDCTWNWDLPPTFDCQLVTGEEPCQDQELEVASESEKANFTRVASATPLINMFGKWIAEEDVQIYRMWHNSRQDIPKEYTVFNEGVSGNPAHTDSCVPHFCGPQGASCFEVIGVYGLTMGASICNGNLICSTLVNLNAPECVDQ